MKMFTFQIDGDLMGIEARHVSRVLEDIPVTPVGFTPPAHLGLIYYHGEIFDVIDFARLLERADPEIHRGYRFILVRWSRRKMAVAVRDIAGLLWTESQETQDTCFTEDGRFIRVLPPDRIWENIGKQPYGPIQV
jgi:chemotaxis signal transduction protein